MNDYAPKSKVFYRPIEASVRWAGLLRYEQLILSSISSPRNLPQSLDCPHWNEVRLYTDRIFDGILNGELPFGRNGITTHDTELINSPDLTIRHVDLKRWMRQHYPEQRPGFLFSRSERIAHPVISLETGQAMLVERQALKSALEQSKRQLRELQDKHDALLKQSTVIPACAQCPISDRAEATYLNIIGGLMELMLGQSPSGAPYSSFKTQEAVPAIAFAQNNRGEVRFESGHGQVACTVLSNGKPGYGVPMVACVSLRGRELGLAAELGGSVAGALRTSGGSADKPYVLAPDFEAHLRYDWNDPGPGDWSHWRVRRLMPVECERLQGMPDDYTLIPYRGKPAADAPRYKAIGNSMAVPCMAWLGQRLVQCLHKTGSTASD